MAVDEASAGKSSKSVVILLALVVLLIAALGGGAAWYFLAGSDDQAMAEAQYEAGNKPQAIYVNLRTPGGKPAFISNFHETTGRQRFLQIYAEARTRSPEVEEALKKHMPLVVHSLNTLFSNQSFADMQTDAGRLRLREEATAKVQEILQNEIGQPGIEAVFFTNLVMQ